MIMIILIILLIMITLTVGNMKGGVVKSIIATNLAVEAVTSGKRTRYTRV